MPPPVKGVVAVTPVMSPTSLATQVKSMSVLEVLARIWPVVPPLRSTIDESIALTAVRMANAPFFTRSVLSGSGQLKFGLVAIYAITPVALFQSSVPVTPVQIVVIGITVSHCVVESENSVAVM